MDKERLFRYLDRKYSSKSEIIPNIPLGENADVIWAEILQSRRERCIELPLTNVNGDTYWYILTNKMISASEVIVDELMEQDNTAVPHTSSVSTIEEVYYTGFMEGAQISVQDAMDFLQSGGEPESVEELILMNSRQAAGFAAENMYHAIDSNYLHNLAYFLTEGLDNGGGDYRITDTLEIPSLQGETVQLPPAAMIPEQTERFAGFLADTATHPLIKAAAAQAWVLAYRPFPEGNERLARLLSNVILIRAGYSFFGEISISSVLARTSYEYFRAIANILRVENGADLTYFLEYYLVALSSAVNDMRTRREQKAENVIEAEQKLAGIPLQAAPAVVAEKRLKGNPISHIKHNENVKKVEAALNELLHKGYEQFTLADLEAITGINRKMISKLLLPYEAAEHIFAIRKSRVGNIYAFRQSEPPEDERQTSFVENQSVEIDNSLRENAISAMKRRIKAGTKNAAIVARGLLKQISSGIFRFSTEDIAQNLNISNVSVRNSLRYYLDNDIIRVIDDRNRFFIYEFSFLRESTDDNEENAVMFSQASSPQEPDIVSSESAIEDSQPAIEMLRRLQDGTNAEVTGSIAGQILSYLNNGIDSFSATDIARDLGVSRKSVNNFMKSFVEKGILYTSGKVGNLKFFSVVTSNRGVDMERLRKSCPRLIQYAEENGYARNTVARVLMDLIQSGKYEVSSEELSEHTGMNNRQLHNALRPFLRMGLLHHDAGDVYYQIDIGDEKQKLIQASSKAHYSSEILGKIEELKNSATSQKNRRIARILSKCLKKGIVTKEDYSTDGELSKWSTDMSFAAQLGLVTKLGTSKYRINTEIDVSYEKLRSTQKNTLSALYDLFGDGMFSAEMVVANLDYSTSYVSGILHQFTMLKLLDCTPNEDKTYSYQLNVNPTDNPECFEEAA